MNHLTHINLQFIFLTTIFLALINVLMMVEPQNVQEFSTPCKDCNIVFIDIDTLRADAIDCQNNFDNTPNLCKLLQSSIVFKNNISQSIMTRASFVSTLTSLYPNSHNNLNETYGNPDPEIITLPKYLNNLGYQSIYVGSFASGQILYDDFKRVHKTEYLDFDHKVFTSQKQPFFLYLYSAAMHLPYYPYKEKKGGGSDNIKAPEEMPLTRSDFNQVLADYLIEHYKGIFTPAARSSKPEIFGGDIQKKKNQLLEYYFQLDSSPEIKTHYLNKRWAPWYQSYIQFIDPNNPNDVRYLKSRYLDCLYAIDDSLGKIFKTLEENSLTDKTIIVLESDHGEEFYEHGLFSHANAPYEELIHTPLAIKIPNVKHREIQNQTQNIDIFPTLTEILGTGSSPQFEGRSLLPLIKDQTYTQDDTYQISQWELDYSASFRKGEWKLILLERKPTQLYNLSKDPQEQNNLIEEEKSVTQNLFEEYKKIVSNYRIYKENRLPLLDLTPERRQQLIKEGYF
ncbi:MAG: sulfatase [bacterium]|nr:sulfatase [bacterium]